MRRQLRRDRFRGVDLKMETKQRVLVLGATSAIASEVGLFQVLPFLSGR